MDQHVLEALVSRGPHPSLGAHADTYGRLIGGWRGELQSHLPGHSAPAASLEIHFGWALEGRAVQDVWITPARDQRGVGVTAPLPPLDWYGTTVRVFDPKTETWRATWWNAITGGRIDTRSPEVGSISRACGKATTSCRWGFARAGRSVGRSPRSARSPLSGKVTSSSRTGGPGAWRSRSAPVERAMLPDRPLRQIEVGTEERVGALRGIGQTSA